MSVIKKLIISIIAVMMVMVSFCCAAEYEDTVRVGIYYGSGAVAELTAESTDGFELGYYSDRTFYPVVRGHETLVTVKHDNQAWHIVYSDAQDVYEAEAKAAMLRGSGINAFAVCSDARFYVWAGCFETAEAAQAEAMGMGVENVIIQANPESMKIMDRDGRTFFLLNDNTKELGIISKDDAEYEKTITISGAAKGSYRGGFAFRNADGGKMTVINILPVEKYLYGVVSREMSASWHVEALKTQAVCARNFVLRRINHHKQYGFDVCRTTCCQAYSGTSAEGENIYKAVDETRGELLMYNDEVCQTVYSSSMGSETESVENVWGTPFPYLVSVDNPYEDTENVYNGKWQKTLTVSRATEIMKNRGSDVGQVLEITPLEYTAAGRVLKLRVKGTGGEKVFEREMCRTVFSEATYSQKYTVTKGGVSTYPKLTVTDGKTNTSKTINSFVLSGDNKTATSVNAVSVTDGTSSKKYEVTKSSGNSDEFVFTGEGWGHGVGMSQYGAKGMAEAGFTYDEILKHYYTGTELKTVY